MTARDTVHSTWTNSQLLCVSLSAIVYQGHLTIVRALSGAIAAQCTCAGLGLVLQEACALSHFYFVRAVSSRLYQHFDGSVLLGKLGLQFCDANALQMYENKLS